jgi:hypothetical protein
MPQHSGEGGSSLVDRARREASRSVAMAFDMITPMVDGDLEMARRAVGRPPNALNYDDVHALKKALDRRQIRLARIARGIRFSEEQLSAWILDPDDDLDAVALQNKGVILLGYIAWLFIPAVAWLGHYPLAVGIVGALFDRLSNDAHREVLGAGSVGQESGTEYLILGPCFASLAVHFPQDS